MWTFNVPFALKQSLLLQAAQQGLKRALLDVQTLLRELVDEGVTVSGFLLLAECGQDQGAVPKFLLQGMDDEPGAFPGLGFDLSRW